MQQATEVSIERLLPGGEPDWSAITFDIHCPRCGYNLRTLTHPRCPECGLVVDWHEAIAHAMAQSELLFEHAWRRRPIRSWLKTFWWAVRPASFWDRISIHDRVQVLPLFVYWIIAFGVCLAILHVTCGLFSFLLAHVLSARGNQPSLTLERIQYQLDRVATMPLTRDYRYLLWLAGIISFQVGTAGVLLALRQTWFKFHIRTAQVVRVIAYALTPLMASAVLIGLVLAGAFPLYALSGPVPFLPYMNYTNDSGQTRYFVPVSMRSGLSTPLQAAALYGAMALTMIIAMYSISLGLSRYLRLPHARRVAAVTVLTASLLACTVASLIGLVLTGGWWS